MSEQQEFKNVAQDRDIMEMRLKGGSIRDFLKNPAVDAIVKNPEMLALVWNTASTNIADIEQYLRTGMSQKFTEPILGRWYFSPGASIVEYRREKPNLPTTETQRLRTWMAERFANTMIVASPDRKILIKEFPQLQATQPGQPLPENQTITGNWRGGGGTYVLSLEGNVERTAQVEGGKLHYNGESLPLVFQREE
jgi:hypothetical protein